MPNPGLYSTFLGQSAYYLPRYTLAFEVYGSEPLLIMQFYNRPNFLYSLSYTVYRLFDIELTTFFLTKFNGTD